MSENSKHDLCQVLGLILGRKFKMSIELRPWRALRALYSSALRRSRSITLMRLSSLISQILDAPTLPLLLAVDESRSVCTEI